MHDFTNSRTLGVLCGRCAVLNRRFDHHVLKVGGDQQFDVHIEVVCVLHSGQTCGRQHQFHRAIHVNIAVALGDYLRNQGQHVTVHLQRGCSDRSAGHPRAASAVIVRLRCWRNCGEQAGRIQNPVVLQTGDSVELHLVQELLQHADCRAANVFRPANLSQSRAFQLDLTPTTNGLEDEVLALREVHIRTSITAVAVVTIRRHLSVMLGNWENPVSVDERTDALFAQDFSSGIFRCQNLDMLRADVGGQERRNAGTWGSYQRWLRVSSKCCTAEALIFNETYDVRAKMDTVISFIHLQRGFRHILINAIWHDLCSPIISVGNYPRRSVGV